VSELESECVYPDIHRLCMDWVYTYTHLHTHSLSLSLYLSKNTTRVSRHGSSSECACVCVRVGVCACTRVCMRVCEWHGGTWIRAYSNTPPVQGGEDS